MGRLSKKEAWKRATREAIKNMNPTGYMEMPNAQFLVMFDHQLNKREQVIAQTLKFKESGKGYAYTYNPDSKFKKMVFMFDTDMLTMYSNIIVYSEKVEESFLSGINCLQFKFKTEIVLYTTKYED